MIKYPAKTVRTLALAALAGIAAVLAVLMLCSVWCEFASFRCCSGRDYYCYTAMIWNSVHGRLFEIAPGHSYLPTHLSFSLLLLSPLFLIVDHPFLLAGLQWLFMVVGGILLVLVGRRAGANALLIAAIVIFYFGYSFAQTVILCEFHGVSSYFFLLPWICYCLQRRSHAVALPFLIMLGIREEAGLFVVPLLLYAGWRLSWRPAYVYAAAAVLYVALACTVLYPMINGITLAQHRRYELGAITTGHSLEGIGLVQRLRSLAWILFPVLPFLVFRGRREVLLIPSLAVAITLLSAAGGQYTLRIHYPAPIHVSLGVGMMLAAGCLGRDGAPGWQRRRNFAIVWVLLATGIAYHQAGFLWGSNCSMSDAYRTRYPEGLHSLWVARTQLPRQGRAATENSFIGFAANRAALQIRLPETPAAAANVDLILARTASLPAFLFDDIRNGTFGVRYADDTEVVLERGGDAQNNAAFLAAQKIPTLLFNLCPGQGENRFVPGEGVVVHWDGTRGKHRPAVEHGRMTLPAGTYTARFHFRSEPPRPGAKSGWGEFNILQPHGARLLTSAGIAPSEERGPRTQDLRFTIGDAANIDVNVNAAEASLWLRSVEFIAGP